MTDKPTGRCYNVVPTRQVMLDDFIPRRGAVVRVQLDKLKDLMFLKGREYVANEVGHAVLAALFSSEEGVPAALALPTPRGDGKVR